jgi:hypothetical protein
MVPGSVSTNYATMYPINQNPQKPKEMVTIRVIWEKTPSVWRVTAETSSRWLRGIVSSPGSFRHSTDSDSVSDTCTFWPGFLLGHRWWTDSNIMKYLHIYIISSHLHIQCPLLLSFVVQQKHISSHISATQFNLIYSLLGCDKCVSLE